MMIVTLLVQGQMLAINAAVIAEGCDGAGVSSRHLHPAYWRAPQRLSLPASLPVCHREACQSCLFVVTRSEEDRGFPNFQTSKPPTFHSKGLVDLVLAHSGPGSRSLETRQSRHNLAACVSLFSVPRLFSGGYLPSPYTVPSSLPCFFAHFTCPGCHGL